MEPWRHRTIQLHILRTSAVATLSSRSERANESRSYSPILISTIRPEIQKMPSSKWRHRYFQSKTVLFLHIAGMTVDKKRATLQWLISDSDNRATEGITGQEISSILLTRCCIYSPFIYLYLFIYFYYCSTRESHEKPKYENMEQCEMEIGGDLLITNPRQRFLTLPT